MKRFLVGTALGAAVGFALAVTTEPAVAPCCGDCAVLPPLPRISQDFSSFTRVDRGDNRVAPDCARFPYFGLPSVERAIEHQTCLYLTPL